MNDAQIPHITLTEKAQEKIVENIIEELGRNLLDLGDATTLIFIIAMGGTIGGLGYVLWWCTSISRNKEINNFSDAFKFKNESADYDRLIALCTINALFGMAFAFAAHAIIYFTPIAIIYEKSETSIFKFVYFFCISVLAGFTGQNLAPVLTKWFGTALDTQSEEVKQLTLDNKKTREDISDLWDEHDIDTLKKEIKIIDDYEEKKEIRASISFYNHTKSIVRDLVNKMANNNPTDEHEYEYKIWIAYGMRRIGELEDAIKILKDVEMKSEKIHLPKQSIRNLPNLQFNIACYLSLLEGDDQANFMS